MESTRGNSLKVPRFDVTDLKNTSAKWLSRKEARSPKHVPIYLSPPAPDKNSQGCNGRASSDYSYRLLLSWGNNHLRSHMKLTHRINPRIRRIGDFAMEKVADLLPAKTLFEIKHQQPIRRNQCLDILHAARSHQYAIHAKWSSNKDLLFDIIFLQILFKSRVSWVYQTIGPSRGHESEEPGEFP